MPPFRGADSPRGTCRSGRAIRAFPRQRQPGGASRPGSRHEAPIPDRPATVRKKELRLALVCYGGVSLAVYMHGITKELWKLLRASEAEASSRPERPVALADTETVWRRLLRSLKPDLNLHVICDVLAGASAGGLNAVFLARAITAGFDLEPLSNLWLENADIEHMLEAPSGRATFRNKLLSFYKEPVSWYAARAVNLSSVDDRKVRADIMRKMSHFVRARWFRPPFSGDRFTRMLAEAAEAMEFRPAGPVLLPPALDFDLYLTATDYYGVTQTLPVHSPAFVTEKEHRQMFHFPSPSHDTDEKRTPVGSLPSLLFAARATASFPGAFPPATVHEIDALVADQGAPWPDRAAFFREQLLGSRAPEEVALLDGSILANAPFEPAIDAIGRRPVRREVDRRFVYIDPEPGESVDPGFPLKQRPPGFFRTIYRAMAEIPRTQPIRESLKAIQAVSHHVRRIGSIIDHVTPSVDRAIHNVVGAVPFFLSTTPDMLTRARARLQTITVEEAGFAYVAYNQLKIRAVIDNAADMIADATSVGRDTRQSLHPAIMAVAEAEGAFAYDVTDSTRNGGAVRLLKALDTEFRIRRMRFLLREMRKVEGKSATALEREAATMVKTELYRTLGALQHTCVVCPAHHRLQQAAEAFVAADDHRKPAKAREALDALIVALDLSAIDRQSDALLAAIANNRALNSTVRKRLIRAWIGFPFYDTAIYPLIQETHADTFDELKVDRIAPDDATTLSGGGAHDCLKGWQMNAFAAFFSRSYRENDYLWGRLHAAERLLDIIMTCVADAATINAPYWRKEFYRAIVAAEEPRLRQVKPLIAELKEKIAQLP